MAAKTKHDSPELFLCPPPEGFSLPNFGAASLVHEYKTRTGDTHHYIARYDNKGKKSFKPFSWDGKLSKWVNKAIPDNRPLFNLDKITNHEISEKRAILIVEGEKSVAAAEKLFPSQYVVTTWQGGAQAISKTDWTPLYERVILIWPDNDKPGFKAANAIADLLFDHCPKITIIRSDQIEGAKDGDDVCDLKIHPDNLIALIKPLTYVYKRPIVPQVVEKIPDPSEINVSLTVEDGAPPTEILKQQWSELGVTYGKSGPDHNMSNVVRIISGSEMFKSKFWYDTFHCKVYTTWYGDAVEVDDNSYLDFVYCIQSVFGLKKITNGQVQDAIKKVAYDNAKNEVQEWINSIEWDGQPRVISFLNDMMGADDNVYTGAVSYNFWVSMMARIMRPGSKVDTMVVFEGKQGKYKSTALKTIGGKYYAEATSSVNDKDFFQSMQGKFIIEIGELDAMSKADVSRIKLVLSSASDRYRPSYGRVSQDFPRQNILVGTTNDDHYLKDPTGNRRFWPVKTGDIKIDLIDSQREQLFAEAYALYKQGAKWWEMPTDETLAEQESRQQTDILYEVVFDYLRTCKNNEDLKISDVALGIENKIPKGLRITDHRLGEVMRKCGWIVIQKRFSGKKFRVWRPDPLSNFEFDSAPQIPFKNSINFNDN
jgi:predicted P-loop ATPase